MEYEYKENLTFKEFINLGDGWKVLVNHDWMDIYTLREYANRIPYLLLAHLVFSKVRRPKPLNVDERVRLDAATGDRVVKETPVLDVKAQQAYRMRVFDSLRRFQKVWGEIFFDVAMMLSNGATHEQITKHLNDSQPWAQDGPDAEAYLRARLLFAEIALSSFPAAKLGAKAQ